MPQVVAMTHPSYLIMFTDSQLLRVEKIIKLICDSLAGSSWLDCRLCSGFCDQQHIVEVKGQVETRVEEAIASNADVL